jgi:hypothetical protein
MFTGVTTPIEDLAIAIQNQGWQLGQIKWDKKLNGYTAEALSPHGETIAKTGPDPATAVANSLLAVTRRNHMRSAAQYKVGMWRTNWHERLPEIAEAYRDAPIYDPKAVAAWKALGDDSVHRLAVLAGQLHVEPTNDPQPYATADEMRKDVHDKRHYYLSRAGASHPVWTSDQVSAFRAVHDILGHGVAGGHYDWPGRVLAANAHLPLLEPLAQQALFGETVARQAALQTYGHMPQKIALFPDFVDHHQSTNNPAAHTGIHPSQVTAPGPLAEPFKLSSFGNTIDVNKGWESGIDPLPYNAYIHHGDPMEAKATLDNAALVDTGWSNFQKGDGSDDRERMRQAIVNAFRVVLLSPRKDLRWNAIHYQDIANIPGGVDDPKVYWDTLENARRSWNEKQGIDPEAHMVYYKFLKPFEAAIAAQHPEKGWQWAKQEAKQTLFNWWTEEQERILEDDAKKPPEKQRHADEIERRANEALARRMQLFLKPKSEQHDVEDNQISLLGARMGDNGKKYLTTEEMMELLGAGPEPAPRPKSEWELSRDKWAEEMDRQRAEERALFERDPQAYYHKTWGGEGDLTHPFYSQFVEWVPIQHVLPYAEWKRNPAHGVEDQAASQDYWDILKEHIREHGFKNPIQLYANHMDLTGHIGEGNHRLAVAEALGMSHVPVLVVPSRRRGQVAVPLPTTHVDRYADTLRPSDIGFPVQKTAAGGQYNLLTGQEALKYGAFMGTHLKAIAQISQHADEILDAALQDVREHDGEGHHFRHAVLALGVSGVGPKVCSFAWLLLQPLTSQLATIDTHMMDVLGHHYEKEMNNRDYFKFEREFRAGLDAAGYGHVPLGSAQWGMWDFKRTGPGTHQDHSAMRVLDPKPHQDVDWVSKAVNLKGESWHKAAPDWWQNTQPAREAIAKEWDETYGKAFAQNAIPYQDLGTTASVKESYDHDFSYYWDRSMPVGSSLDSKARTLAEHAAAAKLSDDEYEDWVDEHKDDTHLSDEAFKRFKKKTLKKKDRLSKVSNTGPTPVFIHPETQQPHSGMPGQSMMEHARLQTGLSTQEIWRLLADEHVQKV